MSNGIVQGIGSDKSAGAVFEKYRVWVGIVVTVALIFLMPAVLSGYSLGLLSKYLCYAMVAVGIGLAWGQGGMLTLGQGLFFGLGAYVMAIHLKLEELGPGQVPDFMAQYGITDLPGFWDLFRNPVVAVIGVAVVPGAVAAVLGILVFGRGVRGAYFAILSQALVAAFSVLLVGQSKTTGGANGLSDFSGFFGYDLTDPANKQMIYYICAFLVLAMVLIVRWIRRSFMGELIIGVRDQENRMKFLGYNPASIKVFAFSLAAMFAGIGGAMFVPVVGIISPSDIGVTPSILMLAGVVIGGRTTLLGPVVGTLLIRFAETQLSDAYPSAWTYIEGLIFILVIAFAPYGLGQAKDLWPWLKERFGGGAGSTVGDVAVVASEAKAVEA
ncbi:urea ABC transporter permease subunit UrtC [Bifidobacterium sp. 82T24]|uniref:Urea ABC transporter permease subunit UrtC n=1 Tax=Bifidobacterium saimiriisciurei TaxID=2661627 RepID=A0ABX0CI98_9BIFI|nr:MULTISPECIES: urea ABC transporter permease subunit UrtC [Bifidobacterium]MBW3088372.1 urea ABC transporter permease subunit UrtC [Bifidobacterium pluvialisilvae]NEG97000.1 urea ABC transporter permease subunit UrtC [Bifidobacterium sp. SMB2]NEH12017.1 urea ABC transporter permease subunit UrtC [Bifidobacterium saimiriisciurei]